MLRTISTAFLAVLFTVGTAAGSIPEQRIAGYEIHGSPEIREAAMSLQLEKDLGQKLTDVAVQRGVDRIRTIGRASSVRIDFRQTSRGTWIVYNVRENPVIESIEFTGNDLMTAEELLADLAIAPGQVLDYNLLFGEVNRIPRVYLARKGILYAGAMSSDSVSIDGGKITIDIQEFKLRTLEVRGARGHLKNAVLKSLHLPRGQALQRTDLLGGLFNVYQLPRIEDIQYLPEFDREKGEIRLVLELTEQDGAALPANRGELN